MGEDTLECIYRSKLESKFVYLVIFKKIFIFVYLVVSISLQVFVDSDGGALEGLDDVGAVDDDVDVRDRENSDFT